MKALAESLAEFTTNIDYNFLPKDVIHQAKRCLMDTMGAALAGSRLSKSGEVGQCFAQCLEERGDSTIIGSQMKKSPLTAALVNGMAAHALELDDGSKYATYHPGSSIVTSALALAESENLNGRQLIEALVAGYEMSLRIGTAVNPGHYLKGFHPTGTVAVFGTTAAASKLLKLSEKDTVNAFGLAGSLSSGINQYEVDGSISKHLHPGNAGRNGITAAMLAREGMTGPSEIIEGRSGFFHCFADESHSEIVTNSLGQDWHFLRIYFKPYCSCRYVHNAIEGTQKVLSQYPFKLDEIKAIRVFTHRNAKQGSDIKDYRSPLHARLSIQYGIASILVRGKAGLDEYTEEAIADPVVKKISDMVEISIDDEIQKHYPNPRAMIVEIEGPSGKYSARVDHAKGSPENPMSDTDLREKFTDVTKNIISIEKANLIMEHAFDIENNDIKPFAKLLSI